jgi:hypothetical protein
LAKAYKYGGVESLHNAGNDEGKSTLRLQTMSDMALREMSPHIRQQQ